MVPKEAVLVKAFKVQRGGETYFRVDLPKDRFPDGKRRSVVAKTRHEALEKADEKLQSSEHRVDPDAGAQTLETFLRGFLDFYKTEGGISPSTWQDYRYHIDSNIVPAIGSVRLDRLEPRIVDQFLKTLRARGHANRTIEYALAVLRRAIQFAVDWRFIVANPASSRMRAAKRRKARENSKIGFLSPDQAKHFLEAVHGDRYEALYVLALTSGMRQGELFGLQWPDIDFVRGKLTIQRALQRSKRRRSERETQEAYSLQPPKTAASRRTIEIPPVTVTALCQQRQRQEEAKALADDEWREGGFVFTSGRGTPLDTSNVLHHFHEILADAKMPKIRFYDLRHTHASLLIAEGVHPKKIAERLGHSSIKLTMDTYGHLFEGSDQESAERMERLFGNRVEEPKVAVDSNVIRIDQKGAGKRGPARNRTAADKSDLAG